LPAATSFAAMAACCSAALSGGPSDSVMAAGARACWGYASTRAPTVDVGRACLARNDHAQRRCQCRPRKTARRVRSRIVGVHPSHS
jgi:hypothetical protein